MPPEISSMMEVIAFIAPLFAVITVGTMVLIGMKMRLNARAAMQARSDPESLDRLTELVDNLHDDVRLLRDEVAELQDRVDFTERMLSSGNAVDRDVEPEPTPV